MLQKSKLFLFVIIGIFINCGSDIAKSWDINWTFLNSTDSTIIIQKLQPRINVYGDVFSPKAERMQFNDSSHLWAHFYISGSKDYVNAFPDNAIINVKLFIDTTDNTIVFDSTFIWHELVFIKGTNSEGYENQDISYKIFYIFLK